jgi:hypothetical protein
VSIAIQNSIDELGGKSAFRSTAAKSVAAIRRPNKSMTPVIADIVFLFAVTAFM